MPSAKNQNPREKASKIPSWIMLGFILGALAFYTVGEHLRGPKKTDAAASTTAQPQPAPALESQASPTPEPDTTTQASPLLREGRHMSLYAMDTIFRKWLVNAQWDYNTTQVVFWNPYDGKYSVPVQVLRYGTEDNYEYYYQPLDKLTRPLTREARRSEAPILFTESEDVTQRRKEKDRDAFFGR